MSGVISQKLTVERGELLAVTGPLAYITDSRSTLAADSEKNVEL